MKMELSPSTLQEAAYCLFDPSSTSQARRDADAFIHSHLWTSHLPIFLSTLIDEIQQQQGGGPRSNVAFLCVTCIDKIVKRDWATLLYQPPTALPEGFLPITPQSAFEQLLSFLIWHVVLHQTPTTNTTDQRSSSPSSSSSSRLHTGAGGSASKVAMGTVAIMIKGGLLDYPNVCARHIEGILGAWEAAGTAATHNNHRTHPLHRGTGVRKEWSLRCNGIISSPGMGAYHQQSSSSSSVPARHTPTNLATHLQLLTAIVGAYTTLSPTITVVPAEHKASANLFKASLIDDIFTTIATIVSDMTVPRHDVLDPEPTSFSFHDAATLYSNYTNHNTTSSNIVSSRTNAPFMNSNVNITAFSGGGSAIQAEVSSSLPSSPSTIPSSGKLVHPNFKRPRDDEEEDDNINGNNLTSGIVPPRYQCAKQPPPVSPYAGILLGSIPEPGGYIATSVPEGLASEEHGNLVRCIDWSIFGNAYIRTQLLYGLHPFSSSSDGVGSLHQEVRCAVEEVQAAVQLLEAVLGFDFMCAIPTVSDTIPVSTRLDPLSPTSTGPPGTPTSPKPMHNNPPQRPPAPVSQTLHFPATWRPYLSPSDPSRSLFGALMAVYVSQCSPVSHPQTSSSSQYHHPNNHHINSGGSAPATLRHTEQALRDSEVPDTALRCLVQLSSCRRTLFDTPEERGMWLRQMLAVCIFLFRNPIHFRSGAPCGLTSLAYYYTRGPSSAATHTRVGCRVVPSWFHPHLSSTSSHTSSAPDEMTAVSTRETFCQLLNRIKPNHQLSELLHEGLLYEVWIHHAAAFTSDYMLHTCNRSVEPHHHHQGGIGSSSSGSVGGSGGLGDTGALLEHRRVYRDAIHCFISPALGVCFRQGYRTIYYANSLLGLYEGGLLHGGLDGSEGGNGGAVNAHPPYEYPANSQAGAAMQALSRLHPNDHNSNVSHRGCCVADDGAAAEGDPIVTSLMGFWYRLGSALAYASKPTPRNTTNNNNNRADNDVLGGTHRTYDPSAPCSYTYVDALLPEVALALSYAWVIGDGGGAHNNNNGNDDSDSNYSRSSSSMQDAEHDGGAAMYIGAVLRQAFPTIGASFGALSKSLSDRCLAAVSKARHEAELSGFAISIEEALSDGNGSQDAAKAHRQLSALIRLLTPVLQVRSVSKSVSPFLVFLERECLGRRSGSGLSEGQPDMGGMSNSMILQPTSTMRKGEVLARKAALALRSSASSRRSSPVVPSHGPFPEGARRSVGGAGGGTSPPTSLDDAMVLWDAQVTGSALSYAASIMVLDGPPHQSRRRDAFRIADLSLIRFLHLVVNGVYMSAYGIAAASANSSTGIYGGSSTGTLLVSAPATVVQIGRDAPLTPHLAQLLPAGWREEEVGQSLTKASSPSSVDGDLAEIMIRLVVLNVQLLAAGRSLQIWGGPNHDSTPYRHNVTEGWDMEAEIVRTAMQLLLTSVEQVQFSGPLCETDYSGRGGGGSTGGSHPGDCLPWFVLPTHKKEGVSLWQVVAGATRMEHPFPLLEHLATSHNTIMAPLQPAGVPPQLPQRRLRADLRRTMCTVFFAHLRQRAELLNNNSNSDRGYSMRVSIEAFLRPMLGPILRVYHCLTTPAVSPNNIVSWRLQAPHVPNTMVFGNGAEFNIDAAGVREFAFAVRSGELGMAFADLRATISSMASRPMFRQGCTDVLLSSIGDSITNTYTQQPVLLVDAIYLVLAVCGSHDRFELDRAAGVVVNNNRFEFTQVQGMRFVLEVLLDRSGRMGGGQVDKSFTESGHRHHPHHHHAPSSGSSAADAQPPCSTLQRLWDWGAAVLAVTTASQQRWQLSVFGGQPLPGAFSEAQRTSTAISYAYMYKAGGYLSLRLCARLHEMGVTHPTQHTKVELGRCTWHLLRTFNSHDLDEFPKLATSYFGLVSASNLLLLHIPLSPPSHSDGGSDASCNPSSFYVGRPLLQCGGASNNMANWYVGVEWSNQYLEDQWATPHYEGCGRMLSFVLAQPRADIRAVIGNMLHIIRGGHSSHSPSMRHVLLTSITALSDLLSTVAVCHRTLQVRSHAERLHNMIAGGGISTDAQRHLDCTQVSLHPPHPVLMAVYQVFVGKVMGYEGGSQHPNHNNNNTSSRWNYDTIVDVSGDPSSSSPYGDQLLSNTALAVIGCVLGLEGGTDTVGGYAAPGRVSDIRSAVAGVLVPLLILCPTAITSIQESLESRARSREGCGAASKTFARYNNNTNTSDQDGCGGGEGGASLLVRKECRQLLDGLHPSSVDTRSQPTSLLSPTSSTTPTNHSPYYNPVTYDSRLSHHGVHIGDPHRAPVVIHPSSFAMFGDSKSTLLHQSNLQLHLWLGHDLQLDRRTIDRLTGNIRLFATTISGVV